VGADRRALNAEAPMSALTRVLCRLEELPDGEARGFLPDAGEQDRVLVLRRGAAVYVYVNSCPHDRVPLEWAKDRFQSHSGGDIVCFAHGAHFDPASGVCTAGVCAGARLIPVPARIEAGEVLVAAALPRTPAP